MKRVETQHAVPDSVFKKFTLHDEELSRLNSKMDGLDSKIDCLKDSMDCKLVEIADILKAQEARSLPAKMRRLQEGVTLARSLVISVASLTILFSQKITEVSKWLAVLVSKMF